MAKKETLPEVAGSTELEIPGMVLKEVRVHIKGLSPLIVHAWSEKAKKEMLDSQMKKPKQKKEAKDPEADYKNSLYYVSKKPAKYGFPVIAFKAATASAWAHVDGFKKGIIRGAYHIVNGVPTPQGDLAVLDFGELRQREDMVRVGMGTADIRYRGEFIDWSTTLVCRLNTRVISPAQLVSIFNVAGFAVGVGEWRPEKDGQNGMFEVVSVEGA